MKKIIIGALTLVLLLVTALSASAQMNYYGAYGYDQSYTQHVPMQNQYFDSYYDNHGKNQKYERAYETWRYQQAVSPYIIVQSPYGKKPWAKAYGDNFNPLATQGHPKVKYTQQTYTGTYKISPYSKPSTYTIGVNTRNYWAPQQIRFSTNPFYGSLYTRGYHCHDVDACHNHNIFPDSTI